MDKKTDTLCFSSASQAMETELTGKDAERRDVLTGLWNRCTGLDLLQERILRGKESGVSFVLCLLSLNNVRQVNAQYGRSAGDQMIVWAARVIEGALDGQDLLFRLGGDEFIAALQMPFFQAEEKIADILQQMKSKATEQKLAYAVNFCYGLQEWTPTCRLSMADMLNIVEEKQYEQKRLVHIRCREQCLKNSAAGEELQEFTYDQDAFYRALLESTDDYIYICNMKTGVFRYPKAMVEEFDLPSEVVRNAAAVWGARVHPEDKAAFLESNQEITDGRTEGHCVEYRAKNRRGEWVWLRCRGHVQRNGKGEPELFAGMITNLDKKNKIDHLTGMKNRIAFESDMEYCQQNGGASSMAFLMLDFDDFKRINDLYNRSFGDEVLRVMAQKIRAFLPPQAQIYRFYGDEFCVVFYEADSAQVQAFYDQLYEMFLHQQIYNDKKFHCSLSGGCAFFPQDGKDLLELVRYADYSLEYAKHTGKKRLAFFSRKILSHKERALDITELLRESIEKNFKGFTLHFQPIVEAKGKRLKGAEALVRWSCDAYGSLAPMEFIPLLEKSGMILPVGRWIFEEAVSMCSRWLEKSKDFYMHINLSYLQMEEDSFYHFMENVLRKYDIHPSHIVLELTESYIVSNMKLLEEGFQRIRGMGMQIAMDDFGTGYSSLGILKQSPADIVKIDRVFVRDILSSSFDLTFIRFVVALCHDVGIQICLEGVETEREYEAVLPMELDFIQGYLFGHPIAAEEFERRCFGASDASAWLPIQGEVVPV